MPADSFPAPVVVYADDDLVVVDKPGGMPSVPARAKHDPPHVAARLHAEFGPVEAVHRLDRDTSGLLVLARHHAARVALGRAFEGGAVSKSYLAIVAGCPPAAVGMLCLPLAADRERPPRQRVDPILGRRASSRWRVIATDAMGSLVELEPITGRSHQLRIHLAWLGCPVLGDPLYAAGHSAGCLALRAMRLMLPRPSDGHGLVFEASWPVGGPWVRFDGPACEDGRDPGRSVGPAEADQPPVGRSAEADTAFQ